MPECRRTNLGQMINLNEDNRTTKTIRETRLARVATPETKKYLQYQAVKSVFTSTTDMVVRKANKT